MLATINNPIIMVRYLTLSLFTCCILFFVSCDKENIDITEETADLTDPEIVETEEGNISLELPNGDIVTYSGQAFVDENGNVAITTLTSVEAECPDLSVTVNANSYVSYPEFTVDTDMANFHTVLTWNDWLEKLDLAFSGAVDVAESTPGYSYTVFNVECGSEVAGTEVVEITSRTEDNISGTFTAAFYQVEEGTGIGTCDFVDPYLIGLIKVTFDVPLTTCS